MHQTGILKRAIVVVAFAAVAATFLAPRAAPASGFHTMDSMRAAIDHGPIMTRLPEPPAVLHKISLRIPPAQIEGPAYRSTPVLVLPTRPSGTQDEIAVANASDKA